MIQLGTHTNEPVQVKPFLIAVQLWMGSSSLNGMVSSTMAPPATENGYLSAGKERTRQSQDRFFAASFSKRFPSPFSHHIPQQRVAPALLLFTALALCFCTAFPRFTPGTSLLETYTCAVLFIGNVCIKDAL